MAATMNIFRDPAENYPGSSCQIPARKT